MSQIVAFSCEHFENVLFVGISSYRYCQNYIHIYIYIYTEREREREIEREREREREREK